MPKPSPRRPPSSATRACAWTSRSPATPSSASWRTPRAELGRELRDRRASARGKVPPQVVLQQVGREAVLDEAVRRGAARLVRGGGRTTRASPPSATRKLDLGDLPEQGLAADVHDRGGRRPAGQARRLQGPRGRPARAGGRPRRRCRPSWSACASRSPRSRRSSAPAGSGDFVVHRLRRLASTASRSRAARARGHLLELGSGRLIPGFEEQLDGRERRRRARRSSVTFPDDYPAEHLAGKEAVVRRRRSRRSRRSACPSSTTTSPSRPAASTRSTSCAPSIESQLGEGRGARDRGASSARPPWTPRSGAAKIEVPHELVHSKAHEMWHRTAHRLAAQGIDPQQYLQIDRQDRGGARRRGRARRRARAQARGGAGRDRRGRGHRGRPTTRSTRRCAPPPARGARRRATSSCKRALKRARAQGADEALREDIAMRKAVDLLVENAKPIPRRAGRRPARSSGRPTRSPRSAAARDLDAGLLTPARLAALL